MAFTLIELSPKELESNMTIYEQIRRKINVMNLPDEERDNKLKTISEKVFWENVSTLYFGWKYDCLDDLLGKRMSGRPQLRVNRVRFGDYRQMRTAMHFLCNELANLHLATIACRKELIEDYGALTCMIEKRRVRFYEAYQQAETEDG